MHKQYEMIKMIGKGGQGIVYLAWDNQSLQYVCIKKVNLPAIEEKRGIKNLSQLHHPGFVKTLNTYEDDEYFYHVMPFVEGVSLFHLKNKLSSKKTRKIGLTLLEMISELDRRKITFNDIKPDNIILETSGSVRLIDYGALLDVGDVISKRYGSTSFSAPEYLNKQPCFWKADLYSIGKTLDYVCEKKGLILRWWIKKATKFEKEKRFNSLMEAFQSLKNDSSTLKTHIIVSCILLIYGSCIQTFLFQKAYQQKNWTQLLCLDTSFDEGYKLMFNDQMTKDSFIFLDMMNGFNKICETDQKLLIDELLKEEGDWIWQIQKRWYKYSNYEDRYQLLKKLDTSFLLNHTNYQDINFYFKYLFYLQKENSYMPSFLILEKNMNIDKKTKNKWLIELAFRLQESEKLYELYAECGDSYDKAKILYYLFQLGNYQNHFLHQALELLSQNQTSDLYKCILKDIEQWGENA